LVVMLAALEAFEQTPQASQVGWEILLTPDEETGSHGTVRLLRGAAKQHQFGLVFEPARPSGRSLRGLLRRWRAYVQGRDDRLPG